MCPASWLRPAWTSQGMRPIKCHHFNMTWVGPNPTFSDRVMSDRGQFEHRKYSTKVFSQVSFMFNQASSNCLTATTSPAIFASRNSVNHLCGGFAVVKLVSVHLRGRVYSPLQLALANGYCSSGNWSRAAEGHQKQNQEVFSPKQYDPVSPKSENKVFFLHSHRWGPAHRNTDSKYEASS